MSHLSGSLHEQREVPWWAWWCRYHCWCGLRRCPDLVREGQARFDADRNRYWDTEAW